MLDFECAQPRIAHCAQQKFKVVQPCQVGATTPKTARTPWTPSRTPWTRAQPRQEALTRNGITRVANGGTAERWRQRFPLLLARSKRMHPVTWGLEPSRIEPFTRPRPRRRDPPHLQRAPAETSEWLDELLPGSSPMLSFLASPAPLEPLPACSTPSSEPPHSSSRQAACGEANQGQEGAGSWAHRRSSLDRRARDHTCKSRRRDPTPVEPR